jgi:hypothetical protein
MECSRKGKWFKSCNFEPRYHTEEPSTHLISILNRQWGVSEYSLDKLMVKEIYVHDVCTTCGKIVKEGDQINE